MGTKISDLVAATAIADTDIMHLRTVGAIDKKITGANIKASVYDQIIIADAAFLKGLLKLDLTGYTTTAIPTIAANSFVEINGALYTNPGAIAITGVTVNTTWYDILLTPDGTSFTASYIARGTGVWSESKQGLYSGNNRVVACVYRISVANFRNKNILHIINRTLKIKMEIGDWNMDVDATKTVAHGLTAQNIRRLDVIIRIDAALGDYLFPIWRPDAGGVADGHCSIQTTNVYMSRTPGGAFDSVQYDQTSYNRGRIHIDYEV